jgi:hypothetical protein
MGVFPAENQTHRGFGSQGCDGTPHVSAVSALADAHVALTSP